MLNKKLYILKSYITVKNMQVKSIMQHISTNNVKNIQNIIIYALLVSYNFETNKRDDKHHDIMVER